MFGRTHILCFVYLPGVVFDYALSQLYVYCIWVLIRSDLERMSDEFLGRPDV